MEDHLHSMAALYDHYYDTCQPITRTGVNLQLLMDHYKINCPAIFRTYLWITPDCFDDLVSIIKDDGVFFNNSNNEQVPVAHCGYPSVQIHWECCWYHEGGIVGRLWLLYSLTWDKACHLSTVLREVPMVCLVTMCYVP